ncbi:YihY/virulence factor BrkB family protein [Portibacter marinus]|uniref:YihY/virulence factor BrkB family protein n=1 Tax=Portibacter marinus TaxID=2898660 RepID=UPI001F3A09DD|nr:YihY/virulence factor BrkB family protein [Portibacter marinus]
MNLKEFDIWGYLSKLTFIRRLLIWTKKTSFYGFEGIPVYDITRFVIKESQQDDINTRANSMAFSFFLALFPAIIFFFTLLPLFPVTADYMATIQSSIESLLPTEASTYINQIISDVVSIPRGGLFTLGFVLALFFTSNGVAAMMKGFEKSYTETFKKRSYLNRQWTAVKLTFLLGFFLLISLTTVVLGKVILDYVFDLFNIDAASRILLNIGRWILVLITSHALISSLYRYGAPTIKRFNYFSPGATAATIFTVILSLAFAAFVNNFGAYNKIYGTIGGLIIVLVWIQFNCMILLIGYEINASIAVNKDFSKFRNSKGEIKN